MSTLERYLQACRLNNSPDEQKAVQAMGKWIEASIGKPFPVVIARNMGYWLTGHRYRRVLSEEQILIEAALAKARLELKNVGFQNGTLVRTALIDNIHTRIMWGTFAPHQPLTVEDAGYSAAVYSGLACDEKEPCHIYLLEALEAGVHLFRHSYDHLIIAMIPEIMHFNQHDQYHCEDGPTISYWGRDFWFWNGVEVTSKTILHPNAITLNWIFEERNAERRTVLIERYGVERFMRDSKAKVIDQRTFRKRKVRLYRYSYGDLLRPDRIEAIQMIRVTNATTEPDGSHRNYWLRVPPGLTSALEAVAWTFNLSATDYKRLSFES